MPRHRIHGFGKPGTMMRVRMQCRARRLARRGGKSHPHIGATDVTEKNRKGKVQTKLRLAAEINNRVCGGSILVPILSGLSAGRDNPRRIAQDSRPRGDIARHHAAGADHRVIADADAGKDNRPAADPREFADPHGAAEF